MFAILAAFAFSTEVRAQSYSTVCNNGYWFVTNMYGFGYGDRRIPCDEPKPAWIFDWNNPGHIQWVYDGDRVVTPVQNPNTGEIGTAVLPVNEQGNTGPAVNQPVESVFYTVPDDADHRAVRGTDGRCYREWRERGRWHRSEPFARAYDYTEACRRAAWNAYYRSQGRPLVDPAVGTFPSGSPPAAPMLESGTVDGTTLMLTFDAALDAVSLPSRWAFQVTVNGGRRYVGAGGVSISGTTVGLTLTSPVTYADTVRVRYARPSSNPLRGTNGIRVANFHQAVANNSPTPPALVSASVANDRLTLTFDKTLDTGSRPAGSAFRVSARPSGGTARTIAGTGTVSVSGATVTVTLAGTVAAGETVTVRYTRPGTNPLRGTNGVEVESFANEPVATVPAFFSATVNGTALTVTFTGTLAAGSRPAGSAFRVSATPEGGTARTIAGTGTVSVSGATVTVTLASAVAERETVTVSYTRPATGARLQDPAGNVVASFTSGAVTNATPDTTQPTFASAAVKGTALTVTFDENLATGSRPAGSAFRVSATPEGGTARTIAGTGLVSVSGKTVTVTLASAVAAGETVTVGYTRPATGARLQDPSGNQVATFSGQAVTNNAPPAFSSATVNGTALTVTFDDTLATGSRPAGSAFRVRATPSGGGTARTIAGTGTVSVSGKTVTVTLASSVAVGETVTVRYTRPGTNPLRGTNGVAVESFANEPVATVPAFSSATVNGTALTVTFTGNLATGSTPAGSAFSVSATPSGGTARTIAGTGTVSVSGKTVTVTLASAVAERETVTVSYTKPASNPLQDSSGNEVATFAARAVTNNTPDTTAPSPGSAAAVAVTGGWHLRIDFGEVLDAPSKPAASAFSVSIAGTARTPFAVGIADRMLSLIFISNAPTAGQTVTVSYTKPASNPLQDLSGNAVATFASHAVTNTFGDTTAPTVSSAVVGGKVLTLTFNELLDWTSVPPPGAFHVTVGSSRRNVADGGVHIVGSSVRLTLASPVVNGDTVKVRYTKPTGDGATPLQDAAGNDVATFGDRTVGPLSDTTAPSPGGAAAVAVTGGWHLRIDFGEVLDAPSKPAASAFSVSIAGTARTPHTVGIVDRMLSLIFLSNTPTAGQTVTVSYTKPASNPLQDLSGNAVADFASHAVTNTIGDTAAPTFSSAAVDGKVLTVTFSELLDWNSVPAPGAFHVTVFTGGTSARRNVADGGVRIVGSTVKLTLASAVVNGDTVSVRYTEPTGDGATPLEDAAGNEVGTFGDRTVTNNTAGGAGGASGAAGESAAENPTLTVADARANEGADAAIEFEVSLSQAASATITVDYATENGSATAGEDYTATSGTLTFAAGERTKTVRVAILDDAIDEGEETFVFRLSNAEGARIGDGEATGTIVNSDHMPKAWTARFGRTVAVHVVDALEGRLEAASGSFVQLGGHQLGGGPDVKEPVQRLAPEHSLWEEAEAVGPAGQDGTFSDLMLGSAFHLVSNAEDEGGGPRLSAWGRVATSGFDGREDKLSLDGTVTTATLGVDGVWKRWLTGLLLAYSEGEGSFSHLDLPGGDVSSSLTSVHPYVAYTLNDRVRLWGMVGYGSGALRLELEDQRALGTDLTMTMGALGVRGALLHPSQRNGLQLALRSDVLWMVMDSAKADNLAATEAEASRLRLVLEGSRPVTLDGGGSFTPSLEVGVRHDGGDAETGTGVEVGGSLRYASAWGLSIEASVRGLLAHEAQDYTEWGASGALRFDPGRQGRGFTASISPTWGNAGSGMSRLWDQQGTAGLVPADALVPTAAGRLDAELGYGLAALDGRGLLTPYARVALTEGADQAWHLGTRLALAESLNFSLEASRRAREGDVAAHELALRANLGF